ncbi:L,D-transpeptidase family protein [Albidovulum inexpectatum]|nr:L,D-transpeptidase family protein [Albidovulum inexpectatum]
MSLGLIGFLSTRGWVVRRVSRAAAIALGVALGAGIVQPVAAQEEKALRVPDLSYRLALAEAAAGRPAIARFYREHDYAALWTAPEAQVRRGALISALERAEEHGLPSFAPRSRDLLARLGAMQTQADRAQLEVAMSAAFLDYARALHSGVLTPAKVDPGIVREVPRLDPLKLLQDFARSEPRAYLRALAPQVPQYDQLRRAMLDLREVIAAGGWGPAVPGGKKLAPGDTGARVVALRDRLIRMDYLRPTLSAVYEREIQKAVQQFQLDHGLTPDGIAGPSTLAEINVGPEERLRSVLVALERLRWMNGLDLGERHVWVNIPDFTAKVIDDGKQRFETITVVGKDQPDRRSPEFSDLMEYMVINPTWNVPRSIAVKEYLPKLKKNPNAVRHLRITDRRGRVIDRSKVDFTQFTARNFPFNMSQPPDDDNALGLVKFMFPNPWNIYLHDTPSKSLFSREVRAFSHGCIRLGQPFEFAYVLLERQSDDPKVEFHRHLRTGRETTVPLEQPVPVHIVYFTAWPDRFGQVRFRRDVYGRDGRIFDALRAAGLEFDALRG